MSKYIEPKAKASFAVTLAQNLKNSTKVDNKTKVKFGLFFFSLGFTAAAKALGHNVDKAAMMSTCELPHVAFELAKVAKTHIPTLAKNVGEWLFDNHFTVAAKEAGYTGETIADKITQVKPSARSGDHARMTDMPIASVSGCLAPATSYKVAAAR